MSKLTPAQVFSEPGMFSSSLLLMAVDSWGLACLDWEPETINEAVYTDFGAELDSLNADQLNASISLLKSNLYYRSITSFLTLNKVFNFVPVSRTAVSLCTLDEILWGTTEARLIEGPEEYDAQEFSKDIRLYVGQMLMQEGIMVAPANLAFAEIPNYLQARQSVLEAEDPSFFSARARRQEEELAKANRYVGQLLIRLMEQYQTLPLKNASEMVEHFQGTITDIRKAMFEDTLDNYTV